MWLRAYLPVVVAVALAAGLGLATSALAGRRGIQRGPSASPASPPRVNVVSQNHSPLALRLYPLTLAFMVFDVAVVALYPWALHFGQSSALCATATCPGTLRALAAGALFAAVTVVAWLYVRRTRASEWNA